MIDRIHAGSRALGLLVENLELARNRCDLLKITGQSDEVGIESGNVFGQNVGRVALRVNRDEQYLDTLRRVAEDPQNRGQISQRRRAQVGTMGKPEEHHGNLSAKILQVSQLAVMVDQFELFSEPGIGDVCGLKRFRLLPACGEINETAQRQYGQPSIAGHDKPKGRR